MPPCTVRSDASDMATMMTGEVSAMCLPKHSSLFCGDTRNVVEADPNSVVILCHRPTC